MPRRTGSRIGSELIVEHLAKQASLTPEASAVECGSEIWTYRELLERTTQLAGALQVRGVGPGSCVGIGLANTPEHLALVYGVLFTGAQLVEVQRGWPLAEQQRYLEACDANFYVTHARVPGLSGVSSLLLDELLAYSGQFSPVALSPDAPSVLSCSSGSTGQPKGAIHTLKILSRRVEEWTELLSFEHTDRIYVAPALNFTGGRHFALAAHLVGATAVLRDERLGPNALLTEPSRRECTWTYYIPMWLRGLLPLVGDGRRVFPTLKGLFSCAEALRPGERELFREKYCENLCEAYSTSEVGIATFASREDHRAHPLSVGRAVLGASLEIVDANGSVLPSGESGEVRYRNQTMPDGYFRNAELSATKFREGWFYPGDVGTLNSEGFLFLHGRSDGMVLKAGVLIHPQEVEIAVRACAGVQDAIALGVEHKQSTRLVVFAVGDVTAEQVQRELAKQLIPLKHPDVLEVLSCLPRTAVGKVARAELLQRAELLLKRQ